MASSRLAGDPDERYWGGSRGYRIIARVAMAPLLGGVALGCSYGNIGGVITMDAFRARYHDPSDVTLQLLTGAMQAGCVAGSCVAGWCNDALGRRPSLLLAVALVIGSSVILGVPLVWRADNLAPLFVGRALVGLGGGLACSTIPLHVSECAPAESRGGIEASFQLAIELGILAAYALNFATYATPDGWVASLALPLPAAIALLAAAALALPESPRYLVMRGRQLDALAALTKLRTPAHDIGAELRSIEAELAAAPRRAPSWHEPFTGAHRRAAIVAVVVLMMQVGTGIDFVACYPPNPITLYYNPNPNPNPNPRWAPASTLSPATRRASFPASRARRARASSCCTRSTSASRSCSSRRSPSSRSTDADGARCC